MEFLNWFIDPVKNKYADFTGRAGRKEFWMYVLIYFILYIVAVIIAEAIRMPALSLLYSLAVLVPSLAITARRLHDTDMSGWWQLIGLIPVLGTIVMIVLLVRKGTPGANQYGQNPSEVSMASATAQSMSDNMNMPMSDTMPSQPMPQSESMAEMPDADGMDNK